MTDFLDVGILSTPHELCELQVVRGNDDHREACVDCRERESVGGKYLQMLTRRNTQAVPRSSSASNVLLAVPPLLPRS